MPRKGSYRGGGGQGGQGGQEQDPVGGDTKWGPAGARSFAEASKEIQASLERHLSSKSSSTASAAAAAGPGAGDAFTSSSDEDDGDTREGRSGSSGHGNDGGDDALLHKVFRAYGVQDAASRTREAIVGAVRSGRSSCLICISSVKKQDAIWTCSSCYCSFHMSCIQRWGKDSIFQQKNDAELRMREDPRFIASNPPPSLAWGCPKCRHSYTQAEIPTRYECFCGRVTDPEFDPWGIPHSCGDPCGRPLQPECGHRCLILCHPGPCPPCPKTVPSARCHCGKAAPSTRRCFDRKWSCGQPCGRTLNCGQHPCPNPCHEGECEPCTKTSFQLCDCHRQKEQRACATPSWQCKEVCNKPLKCNHHHCDLVCHKGACPPCPLSQLRHCPCGKTTHKLSCIMATPTCGDTCAKPLKCPGGHVCAERCHRGSCGSCLQMVEKTCRCGSKKKQVACTKEFLCDVKCRRLRDCRKHNCNRKCCDGITCAPCEQPCNKMLACKNHKCASRCHQSVCYPCAESREVPCACGVSRYLVPCGREKGARPPKCKEKCSKPPNCHHSEREPHNCHFGACPTCRQTCFKSLKCGHSCSSSCHEEVKVQIGQSKKAAVPWEEQGPRVEVKATACPPCAVPVPVTCPGDHETADWPCHLAKPAPCGRECGRRLPCGNHTCERECHKVKKAANDIDAGANCRKCELECQIPRPEGCSHPCLLGKCHTGECPPCKTPVRIQCHCGLTQPYVKCSEKNEAGSACCGDRCPRLMSCGHRCSLTCHLGDCSDPAECKKRSKVYCACKRRKEEVRCGDRAEKEGKLKCDEECKKLKNEKDLLPDRDRLDSENATFLRQQEERLAREELERFEKAKGGGGSKRRRQRNRHSETGNSGKGGFLATHAGMLAAVGAMLAVAAAVYFYV